MANCYTQPHLMKNAVIFVAVSMNVWNLIRLLLNSFMRQSQDTG